MSENSNLIDNIDDEEVNKIIWYVLTILNGSVISLKAQGLNTAMPNVDVQEQSVSSALVYLLDYANTYSVKQESLEVLKILAWLGIELCERSNGIMHINTVVHAMHHQLQINGKEFDPSFLKKIASMIQKNGTDDDKFAIGRNGLYLAFKSAYKIKNVQQ